MNKLKRVEALETKVKKIETQYPGIGEFYEYIKTPEGQKKLDRLYDPYRNGRP